MTVGRIWVNGEDKGSGFALATPESESTRVALTAKHVVGNHEAASLQFVTKAGRGIPVERVEGDDDLDVAVLHLGEDVPEGLVVSRASEGAAWQVETQPLSNDPMLTGTVTTTRRRFVKSRGGHDIYVLQLLVDQELGQYKGYSGSPVALKLPSGAVIGILDEQLLSRLSLPREFGQPKPATNVLYAIPIQDVLERFHLTYKFFEPPIHVPFMCGNLPPDFVPRPHEFEALIKKLLDEKREAPIAITAALRGAGGYGKTTMAQALCHDKRIRKAFDDGILWVTLGENLTLDKLLDKVKDLIYMLSHERPDLADIDVAGARLAELLADRDVLLVVDDVWKPEHLKPFLQGAPRCARLITTRNDEVLPANAQSIVVDAMQPDEAVQLLSFGLQSVAFTSKETQALHALVTRLGAWALLLKLANGALRHRVDQRDTLANALDYLNKALDKRGLTAFDAQNTQDRNAAVSATLRVSFDLLDKEQKQDSRCQELAVFPADVDIPLVTLQKLWGATGGLDDLDVEELCQTLYQYSLLLTFDLATHTIRLHNVIRSYLQKEIGDALPALHTHLLDAYALKRWADLPDNEPYLWDHLAEHLLAAGRIEEFVATVKDLRYLAHKTLARTAYAAEVDLEIAEQRVPSDVPLHLLTRNFTNMGHLLNRCSTFPDLAAVLLSRLVHLQELSDPCRAFELDIPRPFLTIWHPLPDLPDLALILTLRGHTSFAISPAGDYIISASRDGALKVWNARTGEERWTLRGHTDQVRGCAISPAGDFIVSASDDQTLKVWDAHTGKEQYTLRGHTGWVMGCAISPAGDYIVSASEDQTLKVWDAHTGKEQYTLRGQTDEGWAISSAGDFIVSASHDGTLKVWDAHTGKERYTLHGHTRFVTACAISPAGDYIVSASADGTLKVWDAHTGEERRTLRGHTDGVTGCAISPAGDYIVSASADGTLKVWNAHTGKERRTLLGHTHWVWGCAISPAGDYIVSASEDQTLKVWDAYTGKKRRTLRGHTAAVDGCAISPAGDYIVSTARDDTLKVWDAQIGEERRTLHGHGAVVWCCAISAAGDYVVSASGDHTLKIWDAHTGEEQRTLRGHRLGANKLGVMGCAISPAGDYIVSASWDGTLKMWDAHTGEEQRTLRGHTFFVTGCAISPSGDFIVSASGDGTLKMWDAHTGKERRTLGVPTQDERHFDRMVWGCAVSPMGDYIVSASWDGTLKVWDARTGKERRTLRGHTREVRGCAISPAGDYIVSASADGTLKVWDAHTGEERRTLRGHTGEVWGCAVSPAGDTIMSASHDETLKVWDAHTGVCLCTLYVNGELNACAFHPDGEHIVAAGGGGVYFMTLVHQQQIDIGKFVIQNTGSVQDQNIGNIQQITQNFDNSPVELLKQRGGTGKEHPQSAANMWSRSFEQVEQLSPMAADILRICAFLASDAIPEELFLEGASELGTSINDAIDVLLRSSLVKRDLQEHTLSIHRLIQAALKESMDEQTRSEWAERTVRAVNLAFPNATDVALWERCERLLPHALACADLINEHDLTFLEAASLLNNAGYYLNDRGRYEQAESLFKRALVIDEQIFGPTHPGTAIGLNNLASIYNEQGKYEQAEPLYRRALAIDEQILGPTHPHTADTLNNLALLYTNQGKYEQAESLHERAVAIREQALGPTHPDTAIRLDNLAVLYAKQGKYEQAEPLYQRALAISEQILGPTHPDTAQILNNFGTFYNEQDKHELAEPLYRRALAIREQVLGPTHPHTADTLNNLALLYTSQGKYEQAEPLFERAVAIREQALGPTHPDTANSLKDLADLYAKHDKYKQAEPLFKRILAIREQELGPTHPYTANSLNDLALVYTMQSKYKQAELLYERALAIMEKTPGPEHPNTATCLNNLADLYYNQGKYEQAEPLYKRALAIMEKMLGPEHPTTKIVQENRARVREKMKQRRKRWLFGR